MAPLACKTDRIDAWVLAELSRRDLVPAIWLPAVVRGEREPSRWRLHLVRHRTALKNRVHATLLAFGTPWVSAWALTGTDSKRMRAKLRAVATELMRRRHLAIPPDQGRWLASVIRGHCNYYAVPSNGDAITAFRNPALVLGYGAAASAWA